MSFDQKVVIVTGASSGIGAAIAIKFSEQKARVVIAARSESKLKEVSAKCEKYGTKPLTVIADVSKDNDLKNIISATVSKYGKIDILINNAGIAGAAPIWDEGAMKLFDNIMSTNLRSAVFLTNLAAPYLIQSKGNIVNVSSIAAVDTFTPEHSAYCTSKAGLDHFSRCAALDLGPKGVRVNTVNPGPVRTNLIENLGVKKADHDKFFDKITTATILDRVSEPEEVADLVLFLASEKAKGITGSSVIADNGSLLKRNVKLVE